LGENAVARPKIIAEVITMAAPEGTSKKYEATSPAQQEIIPKAIAIRSIRFKL
jgi:hypothetical protein